MNISSILTNCSADSTTGIFLPLKNTCFSTVRTNRVFAELMKKRGLLFVITTASLSFVWALYSTCWRPNTLPEGNNKWLYISHGVDYRALETLLREGKYVSSMASFRLMARLMHYDRRIIPGAYRLGPNMSNWQLLRLLKTGMQQPVKVLLHKAQDKAELSANITQYLEIDAASFEKLLADPDFVSRYGFSPENVLTMFVPNTYEVYWTTSPEALFMRMYKEYQRFWNQKRTNRAKQLKLTPIEVTILASIVEKEVQKAEEAPLIAGVYINRLRKKMALQSCSTLLHIVGSPAARRVLHRDKAADSLYNTYRYRGLPPGPICLPSIATIDAVLNFKSHGYLYFSAREDLSGYHYFSKSFGEHLRYAKRYQKVLNQARVYR